jgi:hypothetical protein
MGGDKVVAALLILLTVTPVMAQSQGSNAPIAPNMRPKSVRTSVRIPIPRPRPASPMRVYAPEADSDTDAECNDQVCWAVSSCLLGQECPYKCQVRWRPCDRDKVTHLGD